MRVLISGATGLVGEQLLNQLIANENVSSIVILGRSIHVINHPKVHSYFVDMSNLTVALDTPFDVAFCALGTTIKKAGSKPAQYEVDHDYVVNFAQFCKANGVNRIGIVSSIGAAVTSSNFYLKTKGEMEASVTALGFDHAVFIRPSFLMGNRKEFRFGEKIAIGIFKVIKPLLVGKSRKYRGVFVSEVAKKLIQETVSATSPVMYIESNEIG